ncbi:DNA repair protein rad52, partial [Podila humilis]
MFPPSESGAGMPLHQTHQSHHTEAPDAAATGFFTDFSPEEKARLDHELKKVLGPNMVSRRSGPGGSSLVYLEAWRAKNLANALFGFDGWSSKITEITVCHFHVTSDGKVTVVVMAKTLVTLKSGNYHEDVGFGNSENLKSVPASLEKAHKEAASDSLKRALTYFGNALGACLYDKNYIKFVNRQRVDPTQYDINDAYKFPADMPQRGSLFREQQTLNQQNQQHQPAPKFNIPQGNMDLTMHENFSSMPPLHGQQGQLGSRNHDVSRPALGNPSTTLGNPSTTLGKPSATLGNPSLMSPVKYTHANATTGNAATTMMAGSSMTTATTTGLSATGAATKITAGPPSATINPGASSVNGAATTLTTGSSTSIGATRMGSIGQNKILQTSAQNSSKTNVMTTSGAKIHHGQGQIHQVQGQPQIHTNQNQDTKANIVSIGNDGENAAISREQHCLGLVCTTTDTFSDLDDETYYSDLLEAFAQDDELEFCKVKSPRYSDSDFDGINAEMLMLDDMSPSKPPPAPPALVRTSHVPSTPENARTKSGSGSFSRTVSSPSLVQTTPTKGTSTGSHGTNKLPPPPPYKGAMLNNAAAFTFISNTNVGSSTFAHASGSKTAANP